MVIRVRKNPSRCEINIIATFGLVLSLFLLGCIFFQMDGFRVQLHTETFYNYETIVEDAPSITRPYRKREDHILTIDSGYYLITAPVYPCFNENEFLHDVSVGDEITVLLDQRNHVVGIETNEKIYLSVADSQKAIFNNSLLGIITAICFGGMAMFLFLYANQKNFQKKINDFSEKTERKWRAWIKKQRYKHR